MSPWGACSVRLCSVCADTPSSADRVPPLILRTELLKTAEVIFKGKASHPTPSSPQPPPCDIPPLGEQGGWHFSCGAPPPTPPSSTGLQGATSGLASPAWPLRPSIRPSRCQAVLSSAAPPPTQQAAEALGKGVPWAKHLGVQFQEV